MSQPAGESPVSAEFARSTVIAIAPALYNNKDRGHESSGDFLKAIVERLGFRAVHVPVPESRSLRDGAAIIRQWLREQTDPFVLFSLSFGSAEVKLALRERDPGEQFPACRAWVNVSGPMKGSAMFNLLKANRLRWWLIRFVLWLRRSDVAVFHDFAYGPGTTLWPSLDRPHTLPIYHLLGFPLQRHFPMAISRPSERLWWRAINRLRLSTYGPHDGVAVLGDFPEEPGLIDPIWGAPHWLSPPWDMDRLTARVLAWIEQQQIR
jgi:hypothetical protein